MNKIGPGIVKIQLKTRAAGISACSSTYVYGAILLESQSRRRKESIFNAMQM